MALAVTFIGIVVVCAVVYFLMELVDKKKKERNPICFFANTAALG